MAHSDLPLPDGAPEALAFIRETSRSTPVLVFKKSPICPVSFSAERELRDWLGELADGILLAVAEIDVIAERPLARGLTTELDVRHESPQALFFRGGDLSWYGSHGDLTTVRFRQLLEG